MPVITIRGQLGSGAPQIGQLVAKQLHLDYIDRQIIANVAAKINWSEEQVVQKEALEGTLSGRIVEALSYAYPAGAGYMGAYMPTWEFPLDDATYLAGLKSVLKELAKSNAVVIRGRGSQYILKDLPGVLHVLIVAPLDIRIMRTVAWLALSEEDAKKEISRFDSSRREFTKRYFHAEFEDPVYYDLVLNTGHLSIESAAAIIVAAHNNSIIR